MLEHTNFPAFILKKISWFHAPAPFFSDGDRGAPTAESLKPFRERGASTSIPTSLRDGWSRGRYKYVYMFPHVSAQAAQTLFFRVSVPIDVLWADGEPSQSSRPRALLPRRPWSTSALPRRPPTSRRSYRVLRSRFLVLCALFAPCCFFTVFIPGGLCVLFCNLGPGLLDLKDTALQPGQRAMTRQDTGQLQDSRDNTRRGRTVPEDRTAGEIFAANPRRITAWHLDHGCLVLSVSVCVSLSLALRLSLCLSPSLSVSLCLSLSVSLSLSLSVSLPAWLSVRLGLCLCLCLCLSLSLSLSGCWFVCLCFFSGGPP